MPCPVPANEWVRQGHRSRIGARKHPHTNHLRRSDQVRRSDLLSLDPTFKRSSPRKFARAVLSLNFARDRALRTPHHLHPSDHTFIPNPSTTHLNSISPPPISIKMSSFRVAAPKMASMAAQSSVKVARPAFQAAQLQKFTRAYSGKLS